MKNVKDILNHLNLPYSNKIKLQKCAKLLINSLPVVYQNNILYAYIKGETLYIATKHQAINFELYQKLSDIKAMLALIQRKLNRCTSIKITTIKTFTKYNKPTPPHRANEKFYKKPLKGDFINKATNPKIHDMFEQIRQEIQKNSTQPNTQ
ncbi:MAG: hypothetical protein GXO40_01785 [Epsilonproteobacteria bacterium]|nr:hypothetical protein [Campylobacterota bacterium]